MAPARPYTSLTSIDALALDTETTGLDARVARIVQVGAIGIAAGTIDRSEIIDQLIDPGLPIPENSTRVHGISDADVAGQPRFADFGDRLTSTIGGRLLIGHSLAYDLTILRNEYRMAGVAWTAPRGLDVRILARLVAPTLADHSLDRLCDWLGIVNARRHSAIGDAIATAEVFVALVPRLREKGIRTLAEAEKACAALAEADARASGGLIAVDASASADAAVRRLDVFAYRHLARDVMSSPATIVGADVSVGDVVGQLLERGISSVFVELGPGRFGIVTERDALRALHAGSAVAQMPVRDITNQPLQTVREDDHVYRALGRMERLGFRHLGVEDGEGRIVGALTPRNLLRNRATAAIVIGDAIAAATTAEEMARAWDDVPAMAASLVADDVEARAVAGVISAEIRAITRRAAELAEQELAAAGAGPAPVPYAVLVLGSGGRGESLLAADQDNAIVFERGDPGGPEDLWFERMATRMNALLDQAGIAFCKGGVMARNPDWRGSQATWNARVDSWIRRQRPEDLLNVDIFFDAAVVSDQNEIGRAVVTRALAAARRSTDFMKMLTELARQWRSPVGFLGRWSKSDGRVDLKKGGLLPIVTGARVLALRHGVEALGTENRMRGLVGAGAASEETIERVLSAHETLLGAVLRQQLMDARSGTPLSPRVDVDRLAKPEQQRLKGAVGTIASVIDLVAEGRL